MGSGVRARVRGLGVELGLGLGSGLEDLKLHRREAAERVTGHQAAHLVRVRVGGRVRVGVRVGGRVRVGVGVRVRVTCTTLP